jgi:predicted  nucleic acid-binding Zn ribbon protein
MSGFFGILRHDGGPVDDRFLHAIADKMSFRGSVLVRRIPLRLASKKCALGKLCLNWSRIRT